MKLQSLFQIAFCLLLASLVFSIPIDTEGKEIEESENNLVKRIDYGTYIKSFGNYVMSRDVKRNVHYDGAKVLDIYYDKKNSAKKPVVIYIYGGSWYMGEKSIYSKLGDFLRDSGYVAVIPNYVQFPFGLVDEMSHDIVSAINWIHANIGKYNGDKNNMIILGHSSGAHLTALTLFKSSLGIKGGSYFSNLKPIPRLAKAVLLNGPYDFDIFSEIAKKTGGTPENTKFEKYASSVLGSPKSCPTDILKSYGNKSISYLGANKFNIVHSYDDLTVPFRSSTGLLDQIRRTSNTPAAIYESKGFKHCDITEGVMQNKENAKNFLKYVLSA
eukprot:jgi/Orpsp1_1/1187327/evm.model.d7180000056875.1